MNYIERTNRQTERLKKMLSILEKAKSKMGTNKFNQCMDKIASKVGKNKGVLKMRKYTEFQKIQARANRRAWWKHNKQNILEFCALLACGCFGWWFWCLLCFVFPDWH